MRSRSGLGWTAVLILASAAPVLADILFQETTAEAGALRRLGTYGSSFVDLDQDGFVDLYVGNHQASPPLVFFNQGDGSFRNQNHTLFNGPTESKKKDRHGAGFADFDNDGDVDFYHTVGAARGTGCLPDDLYRNDGGRRFTQVAEALGADDCLGRGRGAAWLDYDRDGDADLLLLNEADQAGAPSVLFRNQGVFGFENVAAAAGLELRTSLAGGVAVGDYDRDGWPDLFLTVSLLDDEGSLLLRNGGDGHFQDVTFESGIGLLPRSRSAAWGDYDNDGDLDLLVTRGSGTRGDNADRGDEGVWWRPDKLLLVGVVDGSDHIDGIDFQLTGKRVRVSFPRPAAPPASLVYVGASRQNPPSMPDFTLEVGGALDPTGAPAFSPGDERGIFIWKDSAGWHVRIVGDRRKDLTGNLAILPKGKLTAVVPFEMEDYPFQMGNRLYRNRGDGTFEDVSVAAGLTEVFQSTSGAFADFDNDGDLDILVLNVGFCVRPLKPWTVLENLADGTFADRGGPGLRSPALLGLRATSVVGDYDNDGRLDLFASGGFGPLTRELGEFAYMLFRNLSSRSNHWLELRLVGQASQRGGLGAWVELESGGRRQIRFQDGGHTLYGQNSSVLHFGLGSATTVDRLTVTWPSGKVQTLTGLAVDDVRTIGEPD